jgi:hypothetical protein
LYTDIDRSHPECGVWVAAFDDKVDLKFDVVYAYDLAAVDIDHLLIEEIAVEKKQSFGAVSGRPIGRIRGSFDVAIHCRDRRKRQDAIAGFRLNNERSDPGPILLWRERDFLHMPSHRAGRVIHRGAKKLGKRQRVHPG